MYTHTFGLTQDPGCHVAYIFNPKLSVIELLQSICEEFHITVAPSSAQAHTAKAYIDALNAFLLQSHASGQNCVLIIDEAQNLSGDVLEQLRLLTNLETNARKLLQIVLIGQPELRSMLARPELEQLAQRVIARFHLDALNAPETTHYITHRLAVAGHSGALPFTARALARIHRLAHGVPRRINLLCGRALLGAWANGQQRVDTDVVNKAATEVFGTDTRHASVWHTAHTPVMLGVAALLAATALTGYLLWPMATTQSPTAVAPAPALARTTAASTPASRLPTASAVTASTALGQPAVAPTPAAAHLPAPPALENMAALWPKLPVDINPAWQTLATVWKLPALGDNPCQSAALQPMRCHQASKLSLPQLRQLGRPGILTLQSGNTTPVYAVLVGLSDQTTTLQIGARRHVVGLMALDQLWRGDFATYWQPPPGYTPGLSDGNTGPAIDALAQQLARLEGLPPAAAPVGVPTLDAALQNRVRAFQRAQGLTADGLPGPLTFMQIERVLGLTKPQLQAEPG
jgi:general secretion pathway protein A